MAATPAQMDLREDRIAIARFGSCTVARHYDDVATTLSLNLTYDEMVKRFPKVIEQQCLDLWHSERNLTERQYIVKYALADALLQRDLDSLLIKNAKRLKPLDHKIFGPRKDLDIALLKIKSDALRKRVDWAASITERFGECVVRYDVVDAQEIFRTVPDSLEELAALEKLRKAGASCAGKLGSPFTIGTPYVRHLDFPYLSFRGGLAVSYYRLAVASRAKLALDSI